MKNPILKFRYVKGLGDFIACVLHSKILGWLTHFITGQKEPCSACSQRRHALNILFPFKMWSMFYNNLEEYNNSFEKDIENYVNYKQTTENLIKQKKLDLLQEKINLKENSKKLVSKNEIKLENYILQIEIYKL